jgi:hypothetical protein
MPCRAGAALYEKRENLNPFVYQESAARANPHNRYWNPENAAELPAFSSISQYTRGLQKVPNLEAYVILSTAIAGRGTLRPPALLMP